jgi:hypothetical protein
MAFAFRKATEDPAELEEGDPPVAPTEPSDSSPSRNEPMPGERDVQDAPSEPESSEAEQASQSAMFVDESNVSNGDFWARSTEVLVKVRAHLYESTAAQIGLLGLIGAGVFAVWMGFDTPKGHGETKAALVSTTAFPKLEFSGQPPVTSREVHAWLRAPKTSVDAATSSAQEDAIPTRLHDAIKHDALPHATVPKAERHRRSRSTFRAQSRPRRQRAALFQPGGRLAIASRSGQRDIPEVKVGQRIAAHLMVGVSSAQGGEVLVQVDGLTRGQDVDPFMARGRVHMRSGRLYLDFSALLQGEDVWAFEGEAVEGRHAGLRAQGGRRKKASNDPGLDDDLLDMGVEALTEPLPSVSLRRLAGRISQDAQRGDRLDGPTRSDWEVESGRRFEILVKRPPRRQT